MPNSSEDIWCKQKGNFVLEERSSPDTKYYVSLSLHVSRVVEDTGRNWHVLYLHLYLYLYLYLSMHCCLREAGSGRPEGKEEGAIGRK